MVVERQMALKQDKRTNYTSEQFVDKVWDWKADSVGHITLQLRRLGCSLDWATARFPMDEGFSKAVLKVFFDLHKAGLQIGRAHVSTPVTSSHLLCRLLLYLS